MALMRKRAYIQRRWLRTLERAWTTLERGVNTLTTSSYNPFYHLGTLALFLLAVLSITGVYLTVFYRPGADKAYETVAWITSTPVGLYVRTVHRYAADALVIVVVLHALKMFLSDRFWESRWIAWVSGWGLWALIWVIGVMGYWLVWDLQAQWITEFGVRVFGSSVAYTFLGPQLAARSFAFFVIVLFLHIFLSVLIILGFLIHILRLSRPRWLTPRWLMVEGFLVLSIIALLRPASLLPKADFSRVVSGIPLDMLYLAFLPLSEQWGNTLFWGLATGLFLVAVVLPWLWPGRSAGPARITEHLCTGCALCALKCPYEAIDIVPRSDESGFKSLAVIKPNLCVGCGLCIGTCGAIGVDLGDTPTSELLRRLSEGIAAIRAQGERPTVIVSCERHLALNSLPIPQWDHVPDVATTRLSINDTTVPAVVMAFPCTGMLNPEWVRPLLHDDSDLRGIALISCPSDDCNYREGPHWLAQNLKYRRAILKGPLYWLEAAPGDRNAIVAFLTRVVHGQTTLVDKAKARVAAMLASLESRWRIGLRPLATGTVVVGLLVGLGLVATQPVTSHPQDTAVVRLLLAHPGKLKAIQGTLSEEMAAKLPPGVSAEQVLGGERYPVHLQLRVDGRTVHEGTYYPGGLRHEGLTYAVEDIKMQNGQHRIEVLMKDDDQAWRPVFEGTLHLQSGRVLTLVYDEERGVFRPLEQGR